MAIEKQLKNGFAPCMEYPGVCDVRVLGAIGVIEMEKPVDMARMQKRFVEKGIWIRPFNRLVYTMPPYIIKEKELTQLITAMVDVVREEK